MTPRMPFHFRTLPISPAPRGVSGLSVEVRLRYMRELRIGEQLMPMPLLSSAQVSSAPHPHSRLAGNT